MLTTADKALLDAVAEMPNPTSPAAQAVLYARFGNITRVWQQINALLNTEDALAYSPTVVNQLRRIRARRTRLRGDTRRI